MDVMGYVEVQTHFLEHVKHVTVIFLYKVKYHIPGLMSHTHLYITQLRRSIV